MNTEPASTPRRILWVEGSPKGERSLSSACAKAFVEGVQTNEPAAVLEHLDVWNADLPDFGGDAAYAKFAPLLGDPLAENHQEVWSPVEAEIQRLGSADLAVVSSPMWNWSVPHRLKHWIDIVVQPIVSFTVNKQGEHVGVIGVGKQTQLILTRSSAYDGRSPEMTDHQQTYLEYLFGGMLGYDLAPSFVVEPTTRWKPEEREELWHSAVADAAAAGRAFVFHDNR